MKFEDFNGTDEKGKYVGHFNRLRKTTASYGSRQDARGILPNLDAKPRRKKRLSSLREIHAAAVAERVEREAKKQAHEARKAERAEREAEREAKRQAKKQVRDAKKAELAACVAKKAKAMEANTDAALLYFARRMGAEDAGKAGLLALIASRTAQPRAMRG